LSKKQSKQEQQTLVSGHLASAYFSIAPAKGLVMTAKLVRFLIFTLALVNSTVAQIGDRKSQPSPAPQIKSQTISKDRWYIFSAPDKDFVVEFPAKPKREADGEAPGGTMRNYALDTDSMSFLLSYVDLESEPTSREGNQLSLTFRREMLNYARERGWTVIRSELLRKNVYEEERWSPMKEHPNLRLHYVERTVIRYGRQYILTCASLIPEWKANPELCRRFFDSFRVVREPQPQ
jgi:hypothetical protein